MKFVGSVASLGGIAGSSGGVSAPAPVIDETNGAPQGFSKDFYDPDQGGCMIELNHRDNSTAYSFTSNEVAIWIGDGGNNNRMGVNFSSSGRHQIRVERLGVESLAVNAAMENVFIPRIKTIGFRWNAGAFWFYLNGVLVFQTDSGVLPPLAANVTNISAGQFTTGILPTTAKYDASTVGFNKFKFWSEDPGDTQMRRETKNIQLITGLTGTTGRKGIVFWGQSNSSGRAATDPSSYTNTIKMLTNAGAYSDYSDPYDVDTSTLMQNSILSDSGADGSYAGLLIDALAGDGDEYFAVPANEGGRPIVQSTGNTFFPYFDTVTDTDKFINFRLYATIMRCLMAEQAAGGDQIHSLVAHQGESDAVNGASGADYKTEWKEFMTEVRSALGYSFPIYVTSLHEWDATISGTTEAEWNAISDALLELPDEFGNTTGIDIQNVAGATGDKVHLDLAGNTTVSGRIAAEVPGYVAATDLVLSGMTALGLDGTYTVSSVQGTIVEDGADFDWTTDSAYRMYVLESVPGLVWNFVAYNTTDSEWQAFGVIGTDPATFTNGTATGAVAGAGLPESIVATSESQNGGNSPDSTDANVSYS